MIELFWTATGNRFASGFVTADDAIAWGKLSAGSGFGTRWNVRVNVAGLADVMNGSGVEA